MKMEFDAPLTKSAKVRGLSRLWRILVPRRRSSSSCSTKETASVVAVKKKLHQTFIFPGEQSKGDASLDIRKLAATERQLNHSKLGGAENNVTEKDSELNSFSVTKFTDTQILAPPMNIQNQNTESIYEFPFSRSPEERKRPATLPPLPTISYFGDNIKECPDNKNRGRYRSTALAPLDSAPTQIPASQEVTTEREEEYYIPLLRQRHEEVKAVTEEENWRAAQDRTIMEDINVLPQVVANLHTQLEDAKRQLHLAESRRLEVEKRHQQLKNDIKTECEKQSASNQESRRITGEYIQSLVDRIQALNNQLATEREQAVLEANEQKILREEHAQILQSILVSSEAQLNSEREKTNAFADMLAIQKEQTSQTISEYQRQLKLAKRAAELASRKQEIHEVVGSPVAVRRVQPEFPFVVPGTDDDLNKLTKAMLYQLGIVKDQFERSCRVRKIEYVWNEQLFKQFDETRTKLRSLNRNPQEMILFHGTNQCNINRYI
jgi:hypothetical protein